MKRGQVSIFMVLGILILLTFIIAMSLQVEKEVIEKDTIEEKSDPIQNYIKSCLFSVTEKAINKVSLQGGYLNPRGDSIYDEPGDGAFRHVYYFLNNNILPYVLDKNQITLRSKEEIEKIISNYINVEIKNCLDFSTFKKEGIEIEQTGELTTAVIISDNLVSSALSIPLLVKQGEKLTKIKTIKTDVPLRLGQLYKLASIILQDTKNKQEFNLNNECNRYLSNVNGINIYLESNKLTYEYAIRIVDSTPLDIGKMPLIWQMAIKNVNVKGECIGK